MKEATGISKDSLAHGGHVRTVVHGLKELRCSLDNMDSLTTLRTAICEN